MERVFDELIGLQQQRPELRAAATALAFRLAGNLMMGIATGVGIAIGWGIAD